jgi:hypothetical protein
MNFSITNLLVGTGMMLVQLLLALPWVIVAFLSYDDRQKLRKNPFRADVLQVVAVALILCVAAPILLFTFFQDRESLEITGRIYAAVLQLQITIDLFLVVFWLLMTLWPKGGAVALAAFREGVRQYVFWLVTLLAALAMVVSVYVPYFTFGEDYLMVKQLGYDTIMLGAIIFGCVSASLSISEEIEGRTAITVMSKPISRRQFMLGKYAGIILAALFMFGVLAVFFEGVLMVKHWVDKLDSFSEVKETLSQQTWIGVVQTPAWVNTTIAKFGFTTMMADLLRGVGQWLAHTMDTLPGLVLCYSQIMVLVGLSVSLATRLPMVVNLTSVLVVFFLSHLTPALLAVANRAEVVQGNSTVSRILGFVARVFDTVLPNLSSFSMDPALLSDAPPPMVLFTQYVGAVTFYGVIYTAVVLILGLILFEDRDLA